MKTKTNAIAGTLAGILALTSTPTFAADDPLLASWYIKSSDVYARVRTIDGGTAATTWGHAAHPEGGYQPNPVLSDIQRIDYADDGTSVYVTANGVPSYVMGPWYKDAAKTSVFDFLPEGKQRVMQFPLNLDDTAQSLTDMGTIGLWVNGTAIFSMLDGFSWSGSSDQMSTDGGKGIWNRDANWAEAVTFDPTHFHQDGDLAPPETQYQYHSHADPIALRWQLGDAVIGAYVKGTALWPALYDGTPSDEEYAKFYTGVVNGHSPLIGWAFDGCPIYGPYGYKDKNSKTSGVRRMRSGYIKRDGALGSTKLTKRTTLPFWACRAYGRYFLLSSSEYGPDVNTTYPLGRYAEDYTYRGDLPGPYAIDSDWDLDEFNGRVCVTPDFSEPIYAYFITIDSDVAGTPVFPYVVGRRYRYKKTGTELTALPSSGISPYYLAIKSINPLKKLFGAESSQVALKWSNDGGGSYQLDTPLDRHIWSTLPSASQTAAGLASLIRAN